MKKFNLDDIENIKELKEKGHRNWASALIPHCKEYFDTKVSLKFVRQKLRELYDLNVSKGTLVAIRNEYKKQGTAKPIPAKTVSATPTITKPTEPKAEVKTISSKQESIKEPVVGTRKLTIEEAAANMDKFYQRQDNPRFEIDDIIEKQQNRQQKP
jgi:hypothetical protein